MVVRGRAGERPVLISFKDTSVSLAIGDGWVAAWDAGGRLYSLWREGHTFRRGLSGTVLHKWRDDSGGALGPYDERQRVRLEGGDADAVVDEAAGGLREVVRDLAGRPHEWTDEAGQPLSRSMVDLLDRCSRFDARAAREDARRFARVYRPIGILPPDQYLSVVLQATEGCSFGTCTFCDLYHDPYRVKAPDEFARHLRDVRDYLGDSLGLRGRSIFLGAANALAVPMPRLTGLFEAIATVFGTPPERVPVHAFVDGFTGLRKSAADYARLRELGLRRVYVGLESGHDPLLAFVRKPATSTEAVETVRAIKDGGVSAGVIVMIGLGGRRFAAGHVADTIAAVNAMRLGAGDLVYFSDLVEVPGTAYPRLGRTEDVGTLTIDERLAQVSAIRAGLVFPAERPQFARYDVREFVY